MAQDSKKTADAGSTTKTKVTKKPTLKFTPGVSNSIVNDSPVKQELINNDVIDVQSSPVKTDAVVSESNTLPVEEVKPTATRFIQSKNSGVAVSTNKPTPHIHKPFNRDLPEAAMEYPEHFRALAIIIKHNAEIRRFTSLGILNYLLQKGEIKGEKKFVEFKWNKFTVIVDKLYKDYSYSETFFLNCLAAAFASFAASAQRIIDNFVSIELTEETLKEVNNDEISKIVQSTSKR